MILQNFHLRLADPSYDVKIKHSLTIKPHSLKMPINSPIPCLGVRKGQLHRQIQYTSH
ncbi:hypothetical protein BDV12DRAFT_43420 [Aspergillus spectabilis]